jgi:hypothetical protein
MAKQSEVWKRLCTKHSHERTTYGAFTLARETKHAGQRELFGSRLNAAPQQHVHLPADSLQPRKICRHTSTSEIIMASRRDRPESEYDSDDMSAGARLMRYYVSDELRPNTPGRSSSSTAGAESQQSANISAEQDVATDSRVPRSTGKPASVVESATKPESKSNKEDKDDDGDDEDEDGDDGDNTIFRDDLANFKGDVVFDIVGRYSHQDILKKIAKFHPQATFGQKQLTWRIANTIVSRANKQGVTKLKVRAELDAMRIANGVEFPANYRPKSQGKKAERDGKGHATLVDDDDDVS